ncbi:MAG: hypothetical protein KJO07_22500 [Deltaproteobacteria bacterium]|nr:hypothetical protein [Deltaproteobacteria bacterium]
MSGGPWERFARRFSVAFLVLYTLITLAVTLGNSSNERHIFPMSRMSMFSGIKSMSPAQAERLDRLRAD